MFQFGSNGLTKISYLIIQPVYIYVRILFGEHEQLQCSPVEKHI